MNLDTPGSSTSVGSRLYGMRSSVNSNSAGNLCALGEVGLYDHDAVLQKIAMAELMQKRISTGWAPVPPLMSPWAGPRQTDTPPPNEWPNSIAKLYVAEQISAQKPETVEKSTKPVRETQDLMGEDSRTAAVLDEECDDEASVLITVNDMINEVISRSGTSGVDVADVVLTGVIDKVVE